MAFCRRYFGNMQPMPIQQLPTTHVRTVAEWIKLQTMLFIYFSSGWQTYKWDLVDWSHNVKRFASVHISFCCNSYLTYMFSILFYCMYIVYFVCGAGRRCARMLMCAWHFGRKIYRSILMMAKNVECMLNEYKQYSGKKITNSNINKAKYRDERGRAKYVMENHVWVYEWKYTDWLAIFQAHTSNLKIEIQNRYQIRFKPNVE